MVVAHQDIVQTIETLSYKALPALERRYYDGWLIRYANGYTKRANSVNPIYESEIDVDRKLDFCESFFTNKQLPVTFKMTDYTQPLDLDDVLAARQYRKIGETAVYTMPVFNQSPPQANVQITSHLMPQWLNAFMSLNTIHPDHHVTFERMMELIPQTCSRGYVSLLQDDSVVGVALGVLDEGWLGIFDVFVQPSHRGNGYGRAVVEALLAWGVLQGAERAYLQVQMDNTIALQLYRSLGFSEQYRYWYRVKDLYSGSLAR